MKTKYSVFFGLILMSILISSCAPQQPLQPLTPATPTQAYETLPYKIVSTQPYDGELCTSSGNANKPGGFNVGYKLVLTDYDTGEKLRGDSTVFNFPCGTVLPDQGFSCMQNVLSSNTTIKVYSPKHSPVSFEFEFPENKLITIEVPLKKSCEGEMAKLENEEVREFFFGTIEEQFGLSQDVYELDCAEYSWSRGSFVKASGDYKDTIPFKLYFKRGWCSSGGTDCGYTVCFSTTDDALFDYVKQTVCGKGFYLNESIGQECKDGAYDYVDGSEKTIAFYYFVAREHARADRTGRDCIDDY